MNDQSMMPTLEQIALAHRYLYYVRGTPVITDLEYDALEKSALETCDESSDLHKPGSDSESDYQFHIIGYAEKLLTNPNAFASQSMMLGVPPGTEPVSDRSLAEKPPVEPVKPRRKREIRGVIKTSIDGEEYKVEMRETGVTVRRCNKHHVDVKPMREIVDFVIKQERLPFDNPPLPAMEQRSAFEVFVSAPPFEYSTERFPEDDTKYAFPGTYVDIAVQLAWSAWQESRGTPEQKPSDNMLLESCIEFIALHAAYLNETKYAGRYKLAASALREQVEMLAPGMIEKVRGEL